MMTLPHGFELLAQRAARAYAAILMMSPQMLQTVPPERVAATCKIIATEMEPVIGKEAAEDLARAFVERLVDLTLTELAARMRDERGEGLQ